MNTASSVNEEWINKTFSPNFQSITKQKAVESLINYIKYIVGCRGDTARGSCSGICKVVQGFVAVVGSSQLNTLAPGHS